MKLNSIVESLTDSVTLALNAKVVAMAERGDQVFNLTAGQLPFKPHPDFVEKIKSESNFLKSFQYSPVQGLPDLRSKLLDAIQKARDIAFDKQADCLISNGGKSSLNNLIGSLINEGDEIILLAPYWLSYPAIIKLWRGTPVIVPSLIYDTFIPSLEKVEKCITDKTKAIIVNSPNNPTGIHYPQEWMEEFGRMMCKYPDIFILSDEIYYELFYFDPKPTYFYQYFPELLSRTIIFDGISKTLACTGLRLGYAVGPKEVIKNASKIQSQTASGANSLIQRALLEFDFELREEFLNPIRIHLRENANKVRDTFTEAGLSVAWYQCGSAFYYLIDFTKMPFFNYFKNKNSKEDFAPLICDTVLDKAATAIVPSSDFGRPNGARMSLVSDASVFQKALDKLVVFFNQGKL